MALTDESNGNGMVMPVQPMGNAYGGMGGFGYGGDFMMWFILALILGGGWGGFGGFGMGGYGAMMGMGMMGMDYLYPWLNNSQNINDGFRDQQLATQVSGIQNAVTSGFGDVQLGIAGVNQNICQSAGQIQNSLCQGFAGTAAAITGAQNAVTQQLYNNEIANLNRSFAEQTANAQGFNGVQAGIADLRYTEATENCATRTASAQNTRDIIESQTRGTQAILDKLCALELDGVKSQLAQAQRDNISLQNAVNMATMRESQTAQTAQILAGQAAEIDGVYNRLKNCPVPSMPVYGNTPIFTCNGNGCPCGGTM
jgi:hypothetical protein